MEKIIITATAESIEQVKELLEVGIDRIYVGEKEYGLRLPHAFSYEELRRIADLVHKAGKKLTNGSATFALTVLQGKRSICKVNKLEITTRK